MQSTLIPSFNCDKDNMDMLLTIPVDHSYRGESIITKIFIPSPMPTPIRPKKMMENSPPTFSLIGEKEDPMNLSHISGVTECDSKYQSAKSVFSGYEKGKISKMLSNQNMFSKIDEIRSATLQLYGKEEPTSPQEKRLKNPEAKKRKQHNIGKINRKL